MWRATCAVFCGAPVTDRGAPGLSVEDCLTGVPEYAGGCGAIETPLGQRCLRQTPVLPGCDNVASGPIPRLPEYLCGCGESTTWPGTGIPCLNFVAQNICGSINIPIAAPLATFPQTVCGCGDGQLRAGGLPCFSNVTLGLCGAAPVDTSANNCVPGYPANVNGCVGSPAVPSGQSYAGYPAVCISNIPVATPGCVQ